MNKLLLIVALIILSHSPLSALEAFEFSAPQGVITQSRVFLLAEIGKRELTGNNDGVHVKEYLASVGINFRAPYCMAFQYWAFHKAGYVPFIRSGSTGMVWNYAKRTGRRVRALPHQHSLIIWHGGRSGHVGRIDSVGFNGWFKSIEGNTSNGLRGSQNEGNGNYIRFRNYKQKLGRMKTNGFINFRGEK